MRLWGLALGLVGLVACVEVAPRSLEAGDGGGGALPPPSPYLPVCGPDQAEPCASVVTISAGDVHTCARLDDDTVRCWGANSAGELARPVSAWEGPGVAATMALAPLVLGGRHACGLSEGRVWCWGLNTLGQLGQTVVDHAPALEGLSLTGVDDVAAQATSTCVVQGDDLRCFGFALNGQPETAIDAGTFSASPQTVAGLTGAIEEVGLGATFGCARMSDGSVRCWGDAAGGRLGAGEEDDRSVAAPVAASWSGPVQALRVGHAGACVVAAEPTSVHCWGDPFDDGPRMTPRAVYWPSSDVRDMSLGDGFACLLDDEDAVHCLGDASFDQLAGAPASTAPVPIGVDDGRQLAVGADHACALRGDGSVWCWGRNTDGQLGRGALSYSGEPAPVDFEGGAR